MSTSTVAEAQVASSLYATTLHQFRGAMSPARSGPTQNESRIWSTAEKTILKQLVSRSSGRTNWKDVSSALEQYGYRRTPTACRLCWKYMAKPQVAQIAGTILDAQQVSTTPIGTQTSASDIINASYSKKRAAIHPATEPNNLEASSGRAKRPKQFNVGDNIGQDPVEYRYPLPDEILSDLEEVPPTSRVQEQGQRERGSAIYCTAKEMSRGLHGQTLEDAGYPLDPMNSDESQPGLTEQPTSDVVRCTPLETRQTLPPAVNSSELATIEVRGPSVSQQDSCLQSRSIDSLPRDRNPTTLQSVIKPGETASMLTIEREQQIAWASRQVENFEAEIQKLKCDAAARTTIVTSIDQEIENSQKDYDKLLRGKEEEIARVLRELEEQHNKKCAVFESKLENLNKSKQTELSELKRNELEALHKEEGLTRFQAIIDYYTCEESDN
jgi:hypothetical protein